MRLQQSSERYYDLLQNSIALPSADITCAFVLFAPDGPDVPIIYPSNTYFHLRTNLNLSCQAASNPPAQYSWFVNGELLSSSQELFIPNITTNNSGSYTCFVYNSVTGLNKTTVKYIEVLGKWISEISATGLEWSLLAFWEDTEEFNFQPLCMRTSKTPLSILLHPYV